MNSPDPDRPEIRMLREATTRIANQGLESLDLKSLTSDAGTSTSQFSKYFGHKDDLVASVFDGAWATIEKYISARLFRPSTSIEDLVIAVLEGVIDALEADRNTASAAIVIAHAAVGRQFANRLKSTEGKTRFFALAGHLRDQFADQLGGRAEAMEALELLYGAALHRLMLATPLCAANAPTFERIVFIRLMRRTIRSLLNPDSLPTSHPTVLTT